ncbi:SDR family NAD(P)-dependent oxidoreductase [Haliea sp. E17]|uniref:SDR family NAD(P)-dependent oxidoreductase n=1 Tax=Haliea sp. E17 TaxID=3401576 RepID=UPI003AB0992B
MSPDTTALPDMRLTGKTVLVTGASSGLGAHFARVAAAAGGRVAAAARRKDRLDALIESIEAAGGEALAVAMDVTDPASVDAGLDTIEKALGGIDVLVNNAGVAAPAYSLKVEEASWDFIMDTNLKGAWRVAQAVAKRAVAGKRSCSIVNIASILGLRVGFGESVYAISKAAVVQMTRTLAMELAPKGVRVNALCPGYFATEMNTEYLHSEAGQAFLKRTPGGRVGELHELDAPLLLLASDAGSFINGVALPVDGGHLVSSL